MCKACGGGCVDPPTAAEPLLVRCLACGGDGCDRCGGGTVRIEQCPKQIIDAATSRFLHHLTLYERGVPPVAGGSLDQCHAFNEAAVFALFERRYWRSQMGMTGLITG
jgi:hypothetical protein